MLIVKSSGYELNKIQFPILELDYLNEFKENGNPIETSIEIKVTDGVKSLLIKRKMIIYDFADIRPTFNLHEGEDYHLYNYKGMTQSIDFGDTFGGLVNDIKVNAKNHIPSIIQVTPKLLNVKAIKLTEYLKEKYQNLLLASKSRTLYISTKNNDIFLFAFPDGFRSIYIDPTIYCMRFQYGEIIVVRECIRQSQDIDMLPEIRVGNVVKISNLNYISISKSLGDNQYCLHYYQYSRETRSLNVIHKIVTDAFQEDDQIDSLFYNAKGNPRKLYAYGRNKLKGILKEFEIISNEDKIHIRKGQSFSLPYPVLKGEFLQEFNVGVFLCRSNRKTEIYLHSFAEVRVTTNIIPLNENVSDFSVYLNNIIVITEKNKIYQYLLEYPLVLLVRQIPLPTNCYPFIGDGFPISNLDKDTTSERLLFSILVERNTMEGKRHLIYIFDILDHTHKAPYILIELEPQVQIVYYHGLFSAKYEQQLVLFLVTSEYLKFFIINGDFLMNFDGKNGYKIINETLIITPKDSTDVFFKLKYTEVPTPFLPKIKEISDSITTLSGNITVSLNSYIDGYGVSYKNVASKEANCFMSIVDNLVLIQQLNYEYLSAYYIIVSNLKLILFDLYGTVLVFDLDYKNETNFMSLQYVTYHYSIKEFQMD